MNPDNNFSSTSFALECLEKVLQCCCCQTYMNSPITLCSCSHVFCSKCLENRSECPECLLPVWTRDQKENCHLNSISTLCCLLRQDLENYSSQSTPHKNIVSSTNGNCEVEDMVLSRKFSAAADIKGAAQLKLKEKNRKRRFSVTPVNKVKNRKSSKALVVPKICFQDNISSSGKVVSHKVHEKNSRGETLFHVAAIQGDLEKIKKLLCDSTNVNVKDNAGWTPLHEACNRGYVEIVKELIDAGALVDIPGYENETPLMDAVKNNQLDTAQLLLKRGANVHLQKINGKTAFSFVESKEMLDVLSSYNTCSINLTSDSTLLTNSKLNCITVAHSNSVNRTKVAEMAALLNASVILENALSCTHFIVASSQNETTARTLKYLQAVACGAWIVNENWMHSCLQQSGWVREVPFQIKGSIADDMLDGPFRSTLGKLKCLPRLFDGCHFFLYGNFAAPYPDKQNLRQLIRSAGGIILTREPKPDSDRVQMCTKVPYHAKPNTEQYFCTYYILYDPCQPRTPRIVRQGKVCTVDVSWLLTSLSQFVISDIS